jgi:hypothetical protein
MYALDIHGVPDRQTVGGHEYRMFVGAATRTSRSTGIPTTCRSRSHPASARIGS